MEDWIRFGGGALDVLNNSELQTTVAAFLDADSHTAPDTEDESSDKQLHASYNAAVVSLRSTFKTCSQRPPLHDDSLGQNGDSYNVPARPVDTRSLSDFDALTAEDLVDHLDSLGQTVLNTVLEDVSDLM
jgi:hypothetical protein